MSKSHADLCEMTFSITFSDWLMYLSFQKGKKNCEEENLFKVQQEDANGGLKKEKNDLLPKSLKYTALESQLQHISHIKRKHKDHWLLRS